MFEMVDTHTRWLMVLTKEIAAAEGAQALGCEHLVAALLEDGMTSAEPSTATQVLRQFDMSWTAARLIAQALRGHRPIRPLTIEEATSLQIRGVDLDALPVLPASVEAARARPWPTRLWRKQGPKSSAARVQGYLGFSAGAKKALERMLREGLRLGDKYLGSEHLLLGLLSNDDPVGTTVLHLCGIDLDHARAAVAAMPRHPVHPAPST